MSTEMALCRYARGHRAANAGQPLVGIQSISFGPTIFLSGNGWLFRAIAELWVQPLVSQHYMICKTLNLNLKNAELT